MEGKTITAIARAELPILLYGKDGINQYEAGVTRYIKFSDRHIEITRALNAGNGWTEYGRSSTVSAESAQALTEALKLDFKPIIPRGTISTSSFPPDLGVGYY